LQRHGGAFRGWTWKNSLDHQKHLHVARTPHVATQHRRHRVLLAVDQSLEERPLGTDCAVSFRHLVRHRDSTVVDGYQPLVHSAAISAAEIEPHFALHMTQQGVEALFPQLLEETAYRVRHAASPFQLSLSRVLLAAPHRWQPCFPAVHVYRPAASRWP